MIVGQNVQMLINQSFQGASFWSKNLGKEIRESLLRRNAAQIQHFDTIFEVGLMKAF